MPQIAERVRIEKPATWCSGRQQSQRSIGATPSAKAVPIALWRKFSRVRSTARGSPEVPEV